MWLHGDGICCKPTNRRDTRGCHISANDPVAGRYDDTFASVYLEPCHPEIGDITGKLPFRQAIAQKGQIESTRQAFLYQECLLPDSSPDYIFSRDAVE